MLSECLSSTITPDSSDTYGARMMINPILQMEKMRLRKETVVGPIMATPKTSGPRPSKCYLIWKKGVCSCD